MSASSLRSGLERLRLSAVLAVASLATVAAGAVTAAERSSRPERFEVVALFTDAGSILVDSAVKVDGVPLGRVSGLSVRDGLGEVTMTLPGEAFPVYRDARAEVRPVTLLGERFVALERGTPAAGVLEPGAAIPPEQTANAVQLNDVFNVLDEPTSAALAALVTTLGEGLTDNGADAAAAIDALAPALNDAETLVAILDEQNLLLQSLVDNTQPVASALAADRGRVLDRTVAEADTLLAATASQERELARTLQRLPPTLAQGTRTLDDVGGLSEEAVAVLDDLRPITRDLEEIAEELESFAEAGDEALEALDPLLVEADRLLDELRPVVAELAAAGADLEDTAEAARPLTVELADEFGAVVDLIRNFALVQRGQDAASHYLRVLVVNGADTVTGLATGTPTADDPLPDLPREAPQPPDPSALADQAVEGLDDVVPGPVRPRPLTPRVPDPDSVTGLPAEQERALMRYYLGDG